MIYRYHPAIGIYSDRQRGINWLDNAWGRQPHFACVLGFTDTCLIEGISAAGKTPDDRRYTALADAEFLYDGGESTPKYPLPPLIAGASPVYISRSIVAALDVPVDIFNAGLPIPPPMPHRDLDGAPAACLTTGQALERNTVDRLFDRGLDWGAKLAADDRYLVIGECVVGGTTTALGILLGLGIDADGKVNSSHPTCNHAQKAEIVARGLAKIARPVAPFDLVAAVGDPMQIAVAGMAISASRHQQVLLAGGTQMLAVYALMKSIATNYHLDWQPDRIAIGTTRWVADDPTGNTASLAQTIGNVPLLASQIDFTTSKYPQLQAYERGFVKEGVGAGGMAIAASISANWGQVELLGAIEDILAVR